ncbi:MAG: hypothetical protein FWE77_03830, partial [Clostridia bacterium]|nr:hypothetical protein [Clostridia bacterium]
MSHSMRDILLSLLTIHGATGREEAVAAWLAGLLRPHVDEVRTDVMGNLIAVKKASKASPSDPGKRIMFSAHMDHIGLLVIDADEHGFLWVCSVGGVRMNRS